MEKDNGSREWQETLHAVQEGLSSMLWDFLCGGAIGYVSAENSSALLHPFHGPYSTPRVDLLCLQVDAENETKH